MNTEEIKNLFIQGIDCSQVVTGYFAQEIGWEIEQLRRVGACFGGGMQQGETCGAVTGALMVIGLKYGHDREGDIKQKQIMLEKVSDFKKQFAEKYHSCICQELLGYNIADPEDMKRIMEEGLLFDFCPKVVQDVIEILELMI